MAAGRGLHGPQQVHACRPAERSAQGEGRDAAGIGRRRADEVADGIGPRYRQAAGTSRRQVAVDRAEQVRKRVLQGTGGQARREQVRVSAQGIAGRRVGQRGQRGARVRRAQGDQPLDGRGIRLRVGARGQPGGRVRDQDELRAGFQGREPGLHQADLGDQAGHVAAAVIGQVGGVVVRDRGDRPQVDRGRGDSRHPQVEHGARAGGARIRRLGLGEQRAPDRMVGKRRAEQQDHSRAARRRPGIHLGQDLAARGGVRWLLVMRRADRCARGPRAARGDLRADRDDTVGRAQVRG